MLFNSHLYIFLFLPLTWTLYSLSRVANRPSLSTILLILASLTYYAYWNPWHLLLLLPSVILNYIIGSSLAKKPQTALLNFGIVLNLIPLVFFKYFNFLSENIALALDSEVSSHQFALPLAISFFTFQQIAFLVDSRRGIAKEYDFLKYTLFVVFFPQLIAGPIVHHKEMMPQFSKRENESVDAKKLAQGIFLFIIGLGKKVIVADSLSPYVHSGFDSGHTLNFVEAWLSTICYTLQLYFDFSGYSDMALGSALLFGISLPINFNSPYKSRNIQDFWRRWHCTLGRWLKDYIYVPLGGSRASSWRVMSNLLITFVIGGIWHGAGWNFLIWGALHGFAMILHRLCVMYSVPIPRIIGWASTLVLVMISWVFFRATTFETAMSVLQSMFPATLFQPSAYATNAGAFLDLLRKAPEQAIPHLSATPLRLGAGVVLGLFAVFFLPNSNEIVDRYYRFTRISAVFAAIIFAISLLLLERQSEFLYFQF